MKGSKETRQAPLETKAGRHLSAEEAREVLDDVFAFCSKLLHDRDSGSQVQMDDLVGLRDCITQIRDAVAGGLGYKAFEGRIAPGGVQWKKSL
jgi:hypothetical protein